ncbi:MFS transporter [Breoghania sp. JC706]|uniref:MFS transporter n=1 Tax=Breoghania sp. JC706 TaxID=3117732 RepID=UPI0030097430
MTDDADTIAETLARGRDATVDGARTGATASAARPRGAILGGSIGHFIEWYDWAIYGLLAGVFSQQMFPAHDRLTSLIATYSAFAIGFAGRPIGAFVLSPMADKYGRRTMLSATIIMTCIGSLIIALCPDYATIGIAAPIVIVAARLLQGFSAGGEFQIAVTFLNEHAPARNRALAASPQMVAIGLAILVGAGVASLVSSVFPADLLESWGWRLPFLAGGAFALYGLYLRRNVPETEAFRKAAVKTARLRDIVASLARYPREAVIVFVIQMNSVQYYIWLIFLPTYAHLAGGLDRADGYAGNIVALIVYCVAVPLFAYLSDRIGRRPFLIASALCFLVFSYPLLSLLTGAPDFATYVFVAVVGALFISLNNAVLGTTFSELFPTEVRASGIGIPYAICAALFGGTAPLVATWLQGLGGAAFISAYIAAICAISLLVHLFLTPETRGKSLV